MSIRSPRGRRARRLTLGGIGAALLAAVGLALAAPAPASASYPGGNVSFYWDLWVGTGDGLTEIIFPITINPDTAHQSGIFFAQQYSFKNNPAGGYIGMQPRPSLNGQERLHLTYSTFIEGAVPDHPNCTPGADYGPGVSCWTEIDGVYGRTYDFRVHNVSGSTWAGTATDTVTGVSTRIGQWTLPAEGLLNRHHSGFVEYYLGVPTCAQMLRADAYFGDPYSAGGLKGNTFGGHEWGGCEGESHLQVADDGDGVHITRGAVQPPLANGTLIHADSGRCIDVPGRSFRDGVQPALWTCNGQNNQEWMLTSEGQLISGRICLDVTGTPPAAGSTLQLMNCTGGSQQRWASTGGTLVHLDTGLCVQTAGRSTANNATLELAVCDGTTAQLWNYSAASEELTIAQTSVPTLGPGAAGTLQVTAKAGESPATSKVVLTAPSGTVFTGRAQYSDGASGVTFDGVVSDGGRTLELSLDRITTHTFADRIAPHTSLTYTVFVQAADPLLQRGTVDDGTWSSNGLSGPLSYEADGVVVLDTPLVEPWAAAIGTLLGVPAAGAVLARRRRRVLA